jgi:hypothetical protein
VVGKPSEEDIKEYIKSWKTIVSPLVASSLIFLGVSRCDNLGIINCKK